MLQALLNDACCRPQIPHISSHSWCADPDTLLFVRLRTCTGNPISFPDCFSIDRSLQEPISRLRLLAKVTLFYSCF